MRKTILVATAMIAAAGLFLADVASAAPPLADRSISTAAAVELSAHIEVAPVLIPAVYQAENEPIIAAYGPEPKPDDGKGEELRLVDRNLNGRLVGQHSPKRPDDTDVGWRVA